MLSADTKSLEQQTNIAYINLIRLRELQYYTSFYLTFAGQAAIIGGFSFAAITQINFSNFCNPLSIGQVYYSGGGTSAPTPSPTLYVEQLLKNSVDSCQGNDYYFYLLIQDAFWIAQATTMALAFRVMVQSILLMTVGPMKAFSGKSGSIVTVLRELESNKHDLFRSFACMIVGFLCSILAFIFIGLRNLPECLQDTIATLFFVFMAYLYYRSFNSYNKFDQNKNNIFTITWTLMKSFFDCRYKDNHYLYNVNDNLKGLIKDEKINGLELKAEGYMRKGGNNWTSLRERYFIIVEKENNGLDMYYYKSRANYRTEPENPIKERSIHLPYYDRKIDDDKKIGKDIFILKPNIEGYNKNISREWTFEAGTSDKSVYNLIEKTCKIVNHNLKNLIKGVVVNNLILKAEGYMRKKINASRKIPFGKFKSNSDTVNYFIIVQNRFGGLDMYYYENKVKYDTEPEKPIDENPIRNLSNYYLKVLSNNDSMAMTSNPLASQSSSPLLLKNDDSLKDIAINTNFDVTFALKPSKIIPRAYWEMEANKNISLDDWTFEAVKGSEIFVKISEATMNNG